MPYKREPKFFDLLAIGDIGTRLRSGLNVFVQLGFLLLLVLLGAGAFESYLHTRKLRENQKSVARSHEVLAQVQVVLATLLDAESGVRGYVITGSESQLEAYSGAHRRLDDSLTRLERLVEDGDTQRDLVAELRRRSRLRADNLDRIVDAPKSIGLQSAADVVRTGEGQELMEGARSVIAQIESNEGELLAQRRAEVETSYTTAQITGAAVGFVGVILVIFVYQLVRRYDHLRGKTAREAADAHERFRVTLASIGDAVLVTDAQGRLTFCNQACARLLSITDDAIGKPLDAFVGFVMESTGKPCESPIARAREARGVARAPSDTALELADNRILPVDATAATIFDRAGVEQGAVLIVRDVAEPRERERDLARSNDRFRALVLATSQLVWTTDAEGNVQEVIPSQRELQGTGHEFAEGGGWLDRVHPDEREGIVSNWRAAVAAKSSYQAECRVRRTDGSYYWMSVRAVPVLDVDGRVREWVGMNRDIQGRKELEEAEREASQREDEFIALLAHELRNPLAPIRNSIEVVKAGSAEDSARALEIVDRQLRHMVRLVDDLLDVGRITHGKLELRLERVDLRDILRQTTDATRPAIEAKQQHLVVELPDVPLWVDGDPVRLAQVVTNLLNNANKYSGGGASIRVSAETEGRRHLISVRDTGQGIPDEMKSRIWGMFLQGRGRVEGTGGGLGIGLTLVRRLVEMHNGTVEAHSEGQGTGSQFLIRLPVAGPPIATAVAPSRSPFSAAARLRILIVDDNEDSAESLAMLVRIGNHLVRTVYRGESGLEEWRRFDPEVILCDIRMPGMNGFEFGRQLRAMRGGSAPMLVALTGFGSAADRAASLEAGFDRHLVKPVDPDELAAVLQDAARRSGAGGDARS